MDNLITLTQETSQQIKEEMTKANDLRKDATSQGISSQSQLTGISLARPAKILIPAVTKFRNMIPRRMASIGAVMEQYRAILSSNVTGLGAPTGLDAAGGVPFMAEANFTAAYGLLTQGVLVSRSAQMFGRDFDDVLATAQTNGLINLLQQEEYCLLAGQTFPLPTMQAPVPGTVSSTGGTIGAGTYQVAVAARTGVGAYDGSSNAASSPVAFTVSSGNYNSVPVTVPWCVGAQVYDWYVGTSGGILYYYGSTTVNSTTLKSIPTGATSNVPYFGSNLSITTTGAPTSGLLGIAIPGYHTKNSDNTITYTPIDTAAKCNTDRSCAKDPSGNAIGINGLVATVTGYTTNLGGWNYYTTPGASGAVATGAYVSSQNGAAFTPDSGTVNEIDAALYAIYSNTKSSPSKFFCNPALHKRISDLMTTSGNSMVFLPIQGEAQRANAAAGVLNMQYLNKFTGDFISFVDEPWMPDGTLIIVSESIPTFANSNITSIMEIVTQEDYNTFEYGVSRTNGQFGGPRYDADIRVAETLINYAPFAMATIFNIG